MTSRSESDRRRLRVAVVGGGAAGIFGAVAAAEQNRSADVTVFEATDTPLDKVRVSGGGRCNVTHHCFDPAELVRNYPRGARELRGPFSRFGPRNTIDWFRSRGVELKAEGDGRMFPVTDSSATIIECLLTAARSAGVRLRLNARVKNITAVSDSDLPEFEILLHGGKSERFDRLILATGSGPQGYRFAESLGHTIVPCVPSLFTFKIRDPRLADLSGISFDNAALTLRVADSTELVQTGPMLITHWGLSGPAVLKLSAWGARILHDARYRAELIVNFAPGTSNDEVHDDCERCRRQHGRRHIGSDPRLELPRRYWERAVAAAGIGGDTVWSRLSKTDETALVEQITEARFEILGKGIFKEEFVTCGGVDLREIDFRTMQSRVCPGLYIAGEVLDIDGITGGFNFQSAWTTGWIAGQSAAGSVPKRPGDPDHSRS